MDSLLKAYYSPKHKASFGGVKRLKQSFPHTNVKDWLSTQDTYTLHKPTRTHFQRRRVIVGGIDEQWQADLADLTSLSSYNDGYKFLFVCIDVLSKFAWVEPIKNKTGKSMVMAFSRVIAKRSPRSLQTDRGKEFLNSLFQNFLKSKNISFFTTFNDETKASIVERFNRTLKTRMWRYFTKNQTLRYIDVLQDLVYSYNESYHRSIKTAPAQVGSHNEEKVWQNLYGDAKIPRKAKLSVGSTVRISKKRKRFQKGYLPNWSEEIFLVKKAYNGDPPYYTLEDSNREELNGCFYEQEIQKVVKKDNVYFIESVLATRKRRGKEQLLVRWSGYPESFDSWINKESVL